MRHLIHGTTTGYQYHYDNGEEPCEDCRRAHRRHQKKRRTRVYLAGGPLTVDATGTHRRVQALMRIGWPAHLIAAEIGLTTGGAVRKWLVSRRVLLSTAAKVEEVYDRLWDKPGPSAHTANRAKAAGWALPLWWDEDSIDDPNARPNRHGTIPDIGALDEIAVERAMRGYPVHLRPAERREVVARLTAQGLSAAQIAARLGVDKRSVVRLREGRAAS